MTTPAKRTTRSFAAFVLALCLAASLTSCAYSALAATNGDEGTEDAAQGGTAERGDDAVHQLRVIDRCPDQHRHQHADRLPAHDLGHHLIDKLILHIIHLKMMLRGLL